MNHNNVPCWRDACRGKDCPGFDPTKGCKNKNVPPLSWARWYVTELPNIKYEEGETK